MQELDQPHLVGAVARERNAPRSVRAFGHQQKADVGLVQPAQQRLGLLAQAGTR